VNKNNFNSKRREFNRLVIMCSVSLTLLNLYLSESENISDISNKKRYSKIKWVLSSDDV
jgi:hypothetical protein